MGKYTDYFKLYILSKTISILGCGWLGKPLAAHLMKLGHTVKGSTTTASNIQILKKNGIQPFLIRLRDGQALWEEFLRSDILVLTLASREAKDYELLLQKLQSSPVQQVMVMSSTSVYQNSEQPIDESGATNHSPLLKIEKVFRAQTLFQTTVLRFAGLFGYDRQPGRFFPAHKLIPMPDAPVNMIHRDDCIGIISSILEQKAWGGIYNCCADTHPSKRDFYTHMAHSIGLPTPQFDEGSSGIPKVISNLKVKETLSYQLIHNDLLQVKSKT